jgi:hypothetical protein
MSSMAVKRSISAPARPRVLSTSALATAFKAAVKGYPFRFVELRGDGQELTARVIIRSLYPTLVNNIFDERDITIEKYRPAAATKFIKKLGDSTKNKIGKAFTLLTTNLNDVSVFKVGPRDPNKRDVKDGDLFVYIVAGKSKDGRFVASYFSSVEM